MRNGLSNANANRTAIYILRNTNCKRSTSATMVPRVILLSSSDTLQIRTMAGGCGLADALFPEKCRPKSNPGQPKTQFELRVRYAAVRSLF